MSTELLTRPKLIQQPGGVEAYLSPCRHRIPLGRLVLALLLLSPAVKDAPLYPALLIDDLFSEAFPLKESLKW